MTARHLPGTRSPEWRCCADRFRCVGQRIIERAEIEQFLDVGTRPLKLTLHVGGELTVAPFVGVLAAAVTTEGII